MLRISSMYTLTDCPAIFLRKDGFCSSTLIVDDATGSCIKSLLAYNVFVLHQQRKKVIILSKVSTQIYGCYINPVVSTAIMDTRLRGCTL